jgi:hypothetical protein
MTGFLYVLRIGNDDFRQKTALARTSGVPDGEKWVHHSFSPIRWLGAPVHLITSSLLEAEGFPQSGKNGPQVRPLREEEEAENTLFGVRSLRSLTRGRFAPFFFCCAEKRTTGKHRKWKGVRK